MHTDTLRDIDNDDDDDDDDDDEGDREFVFVFYAGPMSTGSLCRNTSQGRYCRTIGTWICAPDTCRGRG